MSVRQSPRRLVAVLALTETVSFGVLLYTFSVLLVPMERDLEASRGGLSAAIAIAALVRAFAAPVVGSIIDRFGVRRLMIGGSLAAVALVVAWSYVQNATQLIAVFVGIGMVGATVFYEPAFAAVARTLDGHRHANAILAITVAAGFASTIFFPLAAWLEGEFGWRTALQLLAGLLFVLTCIPNLFLLNDKSGRITQGTSLTHTESPSRVANVVAAIKIMAKRSDFRLLTMLLLGAGVPLTVIATHLPAMLEERGETALAASSIAGMIGVLSVTGRILLVGLAKRFPVTHLLSAVYVLQALGSIVLVATSSRTGIAAFIILFGLGYGTLSVALPLLVVERFGPSSFGVVSGSLEAFTGLFIASAPLGAGLLYDRVGSYTPVLLVMVWGSVAAFTASRKLATLTPKSPKTTSSVTS